MQQAAVRVITLAALLLLGFVLAYWTWEWMGPKPETSSLAATALPAPAPTADALFGTAAKSGGEPVQSGAIRLLGVAAASGKQPGHAVLQVDGKRVLAVREGEEVSPGLSLAEVRADHVVLERGGVREKLVLPKK